MAISGTALCCTDCISTLAAAPIWFVLHHNDCTAAQRASAVRPAAQFKRTRRANSNYRYSDRSCASCPTHVSQPGKRVSSIRLSRWCPGAIQNQQAIFHGRSWSGCRVGSSCSACKLGCQLSRSGKWMISLPSSSGVLLGGSEVKRERGSRGSISTSPWVVPPRLDPFDARLSSLSLHLHLNFDGGSHFRLVI